LGASAAVLSLVGGKQSLWHGIPGKQYCRQISDKFRTFVANPTYCQPGYPLEGIIELDSDCGTFSLEFGQN
jgi:hypothetical protein